MGWSRFFRRRYWDRERSRELQTYIEIEAAENIARGMTPDEARYAARRKLGNATLIREEIYRMNTIGLVETLWQDLRFGVRLLRLNPGFAAVAIASLALGIGANTAIFQLIDAVRLRTLPVKNPQELAEVKLSEGGGYGGIMEGWHPEMTNPLWEQVRDHQQAFSGMFAWAMDTFNLARGGQAHNVPGLWVSGDFFNVLGVPPVLGRVFAREDDRRGCGSPAAVVSYAFWQRELGGEASAIGKKITLGGYPVEVIGVTPASFFGLEMGRSFDVALPLCALAIPEGDNRLARRDFWWLAVVGRLKPGWSRTRASAHLRAISPGMFEATIPTGYGRDHADYLKLKLSAFPVANGFSALSKNYGDSLSLLLVIAGLVLLIACANLANLMLARASAREREIAVRLALGAARGRLIRQLLVESLLLASFGAALGLLLARGLSQFLVAFLSTQEDQLLVDLSLDWRVLGFTAGVAILTCILFGLAPALRATLSSPGAAMKSGGRGLTPSRERFGLRRMLMVSQIALSLLLLVGALLFVRSLRNLLTLDAGFRQDGILMADVDLSRLHVPAQRDPAFKRDLIERIRNAPGVEGAASATVVPLRGDGWTLEIRTEGAGLEGKESKFTWISPDYFRTMGIPLLAGRYFNDRDTATSPKVAIVNEAFARRLLNATDAIGKTFRTVTEPNYPETLYQIVGVAKNTKYNQLKDEFKPITFVPAAQSPSGYALGTILIRSNAPLAGLTSAVKRAVGEVSPDISIDFRVFKNMIRERLLPEQLMAMLSGFFGLLAAVLATVGLYGVMSYMVARRQNEIGIRMALGADRMGVMRLVLGEAATLLAVGLAVGTALALAAGTAARSMLFGLQPYDPLTLTMALVLLAVVALGASYLPAHRAARLDPMAALRDE
jgi:putative ABC transport system permease protein